MNNSFSRRSFLKGSIVVAVGAFSGVGLGACGTSPQNTVDASANEPAATTGTPAAGGSKKITMHRGYSAAHGDKCFTQVVVAVNEDGTIVAANIDDYQFTSSDSADYVGVPNSDAEFAENIVAGFMLISKADNNEAYSAMMAEKAGATQTWLDSMQAIEEFAVGKTPDELKGLGADAVSGATLADAANYLAAIAEVGLDDSIVTESTYEDGTPVKVGRVNAAPHGAKSFSSTVSLVQGDSLIITSIDEFQFSDADTEGLVGVPNFDKTFGLDNFVEGKVLNSKSVNTESYSKHMAEKAQATTPWLDSIQAIENDLAGKELASVDIAGPDDVSGATLVDTANYAQTALDAAELAQ